MRESECLSASTGMLVDYRAGSRVLVGFTFREVSALFFGNVLAFTSSILPFNSQGLGLNSFL